MKAITICQPWAWAIAAGHKIIENRPRQWHHRGPIAIHAGLSTKWMRAGCEFLRAKGITLPERFEFGAVIAVAQLVHCQKLADMSAALLCCMRRDIAQQIADGWATGPYCLFLEDALPIPSFQCKGQLGLWECDLEPPRGPTARQIMADMARWQTQIGSAVHGPGIITDGEEFETFFTCEPKCSGG